MSLPVRFSLVEPSDEGKPHELPFCTFVPQPFPVGFGLLMDFIPLISFPKDLLPSLGSLLQILFGIFYEAYGFTIYLFDPISYRRSGILHDCYLTNRHNLGCFELWLLESGCFTTPRKAFRPNLSSCLIFSQVLGCCNFCSIPSDKLLVRSILSILPF